MKNLQTEADRIRAKENGSEGLSVGQATQLARNEQALEKLQVPHHCGATPFS